MADAAAELRDQFLIEARDLITTAGECIMCLERAPEDRDTIGALFRSVHTLKGNSGLFDIAPLTRAVHAAEDLLEPVRSGTLALRPEMADEILAVLDTVTTWLDSFEAQGHLPDGADGVAADLALRLRAFRADLPVEEAVTGHGIFTRLAGRSACGRA